MKKRIIIAAIFGLLSFCYKGFAQKNPKLKDVKNMMEDARAVGSLPYFVIAAGNDTTWGKDIEWKWNKKLKIGEYHLDEKVFRQDSIFFYQDKDGFYSLMHRTRGKEVSSIKWARIINEKAEVFINNWTPTGSGSTFNPAVTGSSGQRTGLDPNKPIGYSGGSSSSSGLQYFIRKAGAKSTPVLLTYKTLKEQLGDNKAALAQFNAEFSDVEDQENAITHWGKLKSVLDILNQ